jgi:hypothetical protein
MGEHQRLNYLFRREARQTLVLKRQLGRLGWETRRLQYDLITLLRRTSPTEHLLPEMR